MAFAKGTHNPVDKTRTPSLIASVIASRENMVANRRFNAWPLVSILRMYVLRVKMNMDIQNRVKNP
jgi:hypothetical protein